MNTSTKSSSNLFSKQIVIKKSFKLVDFHIYDEESNKNSFQAMNATDENSDNSDEENVPKSFKDNSKFIIQMFGINEQGETCSISVDDYNPFFFVKVGDHWEGRNVTSFMADLKQKVGKYYEDSILKGELQMYQKLYGFSGGKSHKFVKITFKNTACMNKAKNMWYEYSKDNGERKRKPYLFSGTSLELYESNIPPLLRYFHINNISPSGWVSIPINRVNSPAVKTTTCKYEYLCSEKQVSPLPEKETRVPYKICSFDIEASSSHGDFPVPKKTYKRLASNMVDCFIKYCDAQDIDVNMAQGLLRRIIMTAFKYDKFNDIDFVYPKVYPSKEKVKLLIDTLISTPILNAKKLSDDENKRELLTIDTIFENIRSDADNTRDNGLRDCVDDDSDGEADDEYDENAEAPKYTYKKKAKVTIGLNKTTTLADVLISNDYTRDEKIQYSNELLTILFPKLEGDKTTFIGSTFMKYGETTPYLNHCLVLGSCDPVNNVEIETANTERELLLKWTELIQRENPDIIIGYNIFGFDYEFLFRRAEELHCERDFLLLSRKIGELSANETKEGTLSLENTKVVLASGEYDLRYPKMYGRLQIDMYTYFRRDFNLSSYKLDDVAGLYISDDIKKIVLSENPVTQTPITELWSSNLTGLNIDDYIHIELSAFTSDYYQDGKKFKVVNIIRDQEVTEIVKGKETSVKYNIIVIDGHHSIDKSKSIKWGMAKDDVTPQDIFRLANGSSSDRAIVAKYCIQDCNLVHHLMNKIDVVTGYIEMSRICSVPISFLVFRGQGIKLTSYVAKKCREKNTLMPDLEKGADEGGYEGAIVLPPKCSMYMDNPIACVDYSSLYPSSMISQNYSHDSKVWTKEYTLSGKLIAETGEKDRTGKYIYDNLPGYQYIDIEFDTYRYLRNPEKPAAKAVKTKVGKKICRWATFPDNKKGIMPSILEELLKARSDTRKMAKTEKDPFMQNILDKRQLGYKVTANSLYGQCGARTSTFYEKDVAASTTATGRMMITYARRIIEEVYGGLEYETENHGKVITHAEYVYGDTDSVFFTFNLEDPVTKEKIVGRKALEITIEIAQDAAKLCSQWLKPPMELSYEKTLMPFILLSKKRYVGMLYETDPNKGKLKYMGLSLKRRDSCDYLKDTYGGILNILMKENNIQKSIDFLYNSLDQLVQGKVPMDKLAITKALRSDYAKPNQIAHKVLADRIGQRDPGNKPKPGDRIKFVHVVNNNTKALQGEKIETPEFIISSGAKIDYTFYITNQLMKPLQQLYGLALEQIWTYQGKTAAVRAFRAELNKLGKEFPDLEVFMKRREKLASAKIKALLFDKYLTKIYNEKNNVREITSFFKKA
jgi:DNA polymerase elongation subunit (family B)